MALVANSSWHQPQTRGDHTHLRTPGIQASSITVDDPTRPDCHLRTPYATHVRTLAHTNLKFRGFGVPVSRSWTHLRSLSCLPAHDLLSSQTSSEASPRRIRSLMLLNFFRPTRVPHRREGITTCASEGCPVSGRVPWAQVDHSSGRRRTPNK